jgi:hypothetical protein
MNYSLYHHQGSIYKILRKVYHHNFPDIDDVKLLRDSLYFCDHVLKDQTHYLFCETVQEAEIV